MTGTKPILPSAGLADRELRHRTGRWRLSLGPRQRGANERPVDRTFFVFATLGVFFVRGPTVRRIVGLQRARVRLAVRSPRFERRLLQIGRLLIWRQVWVLIGRVVRNPLRRARRYLCVQSGRRLGFATLAGDPGVLIVVFRVAGRAARLLHVGANHRHDRVIGHAPLPRAVIIQNVTKPKLALLHPKSPEISRRIRWRGKEVRKADRILAELVATRPATAERPPIGPRPLPAPSIAASASRPRMPEA